MLQLVLNIINFGSHFQWCNSLRVKKMWTILSIVISLSALIAMPSQLIYSLFLPSFYSFWTAFQSHPLQILPTNFVKTSSHIFRTKWEQKSSFTKDFSFGFRPSKGWQNNWEPSSNNNGSSINSAESFDNINLFKTRQLSW